MFLRFITFAIVPTFLIFSNSFAKRDNYSCPQCSNRTRIPLLDDTSTGIPDATAIAEKLRKPASIDCNAQISETDKAYAVGPYHLHTTDCRDLKRRHSLLRRDLNISTEEEYAFWYLKDEIQRLRDKIIVDSVNVGFDIMDGKDNRVDIVKHPEIAGLLSEYNKKMAHLRRKVGELKKSFKGTAPERYMAYVEQGLVIDVKNESFKMNIGSLRSEIISIYMLKTSKEQRGDIKALNLTKDGKVLYETALRLLSKTLDDKRNPMDHPDHYLNNIMITQEVRRVFFKDRCPKKKAYCRGLNNSFTQIDIPGNSKKEKRILFKSLLKRASVEKVKKEIEMTYPTRSALIRAYAYKGPDKEGVPQLKDYDGSLLYKQSIAMSVFRDKKKKFSTSWTFPETARNASEKRVLQKKFNTKKFSEEELQILAETNSLSNHEELEMDSSKWYWWNDKHRHYYKSVNRPRDMKYSALSY